MLCIKNLHQHKEACPLYMLESLAHAASCPSPAETRKTKEFSISEIAAKAI
jgi:hypothetical protein